MVKYVISRRSNNSNSIIDVRLLSKGCSRKTGRFCNTKKKLPLIAVFFVKVGWYVHENQLTFSKAFKISFFSNYILTITKSRSFGLLECGLQDLCVNNHHFCATGKIMLSEREVFQKRFPIPEFAYKWFAKSFWVSVDLAGS